VLIPQAAGRRVLVTGAGGFIGSEMARVLAASGAERVVLLDICEQRLFEIAEEVGERDVAVLGSVCDDALLEDVFREHRPDVVIHAAALKHVPLMEQNPLAAVDTNALGTWRVAQAAEACGARQMVLVSTDKAVAPPSIMGAAKRIAEMVMLEPGRMRRSVVRLVNVIGSPGSVGPLFAEQMAQGGPVTVTHPEARRYFITLDQVVALLAQAITNEDAAGVLVPEPGEPMRITDLAERMIAASGRKVEIAYTGERPGDKLDEALLGAEERLDGWATAGLRRVLSPRAESLELYLRALEAAAARRNAAEMLRVVADLVPDYEPSAVVRGIAAEATPAGR
jgi:O-antigen biosynthesis protein WbqV